MEPLPVSWFHEDVKRSRPRVLLVPLLVPLLVVASVAGCFNPDASDTVIASATGDDGATGDPSEDGMAREDEVDAGPDDGATTTASVACTPGVFGVARFGESCFQR